MTKVLYLILNFKTYSDTIRVTNELLQTDRKDFKILIVDNASPNESFEEISKTFAGNEYVDVILSPENGGYAKGNNFGLRYARKYSPEFVCIMNNDVHFSWDIIDSLCSIYGKLEKPAIISPLQKLPDGSILSFPEMRVPDLCYDIGIYTHLFRPKQHKYQSNTEFKNVQRVGFVPGAFLFVNYKVFEDLGFFDESTFLFGEERFTGKIVQLAGLSNYLILDCVYLHEHSKTINLEASHKRQRLMIHRGRILYHKRFDKYAALTVPLLNALYWWSEFKCFIVRCVKK